MTLSGRFLELFRGSEIAHGRTSVGRVTRTGKAEAVSNVVTEPLTEDLIQQHLDGLLGVGAIPITTENTCRFGVIDVDDYDLNLEDVCSRVRDLGAPMTVCRSKSGGAHLYLFLDDYYPASEVREALVELSTSLGFAGRELFPKQDEVLIDRGDTGNFINLPYFQARRSMRYAMDDKGGALTLEQFMERAEKQRTKLADLRKFYLVQVDTETEASALKDFPPCIQRIIARGGFSMHRNESLFHSAVALKKAHPEDWEEAIEEFNQNYMVPPLPANEVTAIQQQHLKKDWGFKCDNVPMRDYCDKVLCKQLRYGIGGGAGGSFPEISGMTVMLSDPRLYYVNVNGKRLELTVKQLNSPKEFQLTCLHELNFRPDVIKDRNWTELVNRLMKEAVYVEVAPELTNKGMFYELLRLFCTGPVRAIGRQELLLGKPLTEEGFHYFTLQGLVDFLRVKSFPEVNKAQVQELIRTLLPPDADLTTKLNYRKSDGQRAQIRVWYVPEFDTTEIYTPIEGEDEQDPGNVPF